MTELTTILQRFHHRYRRALLAKAGVLAALGGALLGVLAWRLAMWQAPGLWRGGIVGGLAGLAVLALGWWLRQRWISPRGAAAHLDQTLGLQQRLVTAEEFADTAQASSLYPLLVEDAARHCAPDRARFPRPWDRLATSLAVMLLLLLLLPRAGVLPKQLAQLPHAVQPPQPPESKTPPPPQPPQQSPQDQQQPSQGAQSQQQPGQQGKGNQQAEGGSESDGTEQTKAGQRAGDVSQKAGGSASQDAQLQRSSAQQADASTRQADAGQRGQQSGERQGQQQGQQGGQQQSGPQQASAQQGQGKGGSGMSPGDQAALKAEIQGLLKEVSGELKDLQAQLEKAQNLPKPEAGTSTDPNLYDSAAEPPAPKGTSALPIQLQTDDAQVKTQRPGGGTGRPSTVASAATPKTTAESASLSEAPLEETATSRQSVPPEYRGVFDRVRRSSGQPSEQKP